MRRLACGASLGLLVTLLASSSTGQRGGVFRESRDHPAVRYSSGTTNDAVTALNLAVQAGETWLFQLWFRDVNPGNTSNFTDGIAITFV